MKHRRSLFIASLLAVVALFTSSSESQAQASTATTTTAPIDAQLKPQLEAVYAQWRAAMIKKNHRQWSQNTAIAKQITVKNRLLSEKRSFPAHVFSLPAAPPSLLGLKALRVESKGATASAVYFGNVDFGVGGAPSENVLQLHFVHERGGWKYYNADFFNLSILKKEREQLKAGNYTFAKQQGFAPTGKVPANPIQIGGVQYIAKVYVFCPGREVKLKVNKLSDHIYQDNKISEVVIGGARNGSNEISFAIRTLEGSDGKDPMTIRVYLMSQIKGVQPIKAYEYQLKAGEAAKPVGTGHFVIGPAEVRKLQGK